MLGLITVAVLGAALSGFIVGIKFALRAKREPANRANHVLKSCLGFLLGGYLSYPILLGPAIGTVACSFGVGVDVKERVDLRTNGYEVDWPQEDQTRPLLVQGVKDIVSGRIRFFETSSYYRNRDLQRVTLGRADSAYCVRVQDFAYDDFNLPPGTCVQVRRVNDRLSNFVLELSPGFWRSDSFERSVELVDRARQRLVASYTERRIPNAKFGGPSWVDDKRCPEYSGSTGRMSPLYTLSEYALVKSESPAKVANGVQDEPTSACVLPTLPEVVEVHHYISAAGRRPIDIRIDNGGQYAWENDVYVNRPGVPVVLWLTNADPVVWRIRQTPESRIVAVIAESWQTGVAVTGVRADTPLLITAKKYSRMANCRGNEFANARNAIARFGVASDVKGDKRYASGAEVIPFDVGPRLGADHYVEYEDIAVTRYALSAD